MSAALKALESASRRELQALAKELQLCRGNAKSDVIMSHAMQFLDDHPKDGEQKVLGALGGSGSSSPVAAKKEPTPKKESTPKKETPKKASVELVVDTSAKSAKQQPEDEPTITVKSVEVVETKPATEEKKKTPTKKSSGTETEKDAKKTTPKSKKKAKQTPSPVSAAKSTPTAASPAKSPKASAKSSPSTTNSPTSKKSPTNKSQPPAIEEVSATKKKDSPTNKKAAPVGKKAEVKARKAVEALVKSVPDLTFVGNARVRCSTTGHEMLADVDVIKKYINGKRYQKARNLKLSFAKYAPMFVNHPDESKADMLWCNVTESAIARDEKRVKDHISAPKYQKQLPIWKEQEASKKKAEEEEAQRRAARIVAAKKRRLEAADEDGADAAESDRPTKAKRTAAAAAVSK